MDRLWFQLPGPANFVEEVAQGLDGGENIVLYVPSRLSESLRDALRTRLATGTRSWRQLDPTIRETSGILDLLRQTLIDVEERESVLSVGDLVRCASFSGHVIWVQAPGDKDVEKWESFLSSYARACRACDECDRSVFCLTLCGSNTRARMPEEVALSSRTWDGQVRGLDVWAFVRHRHNEQDLDPILNDLAAAVVAELAGHDLDLAEHLVRCRLDELLSPIPILTDYAKAHNWNSGQVAHPSWTEWQVGITDYGSTVNSALLALDGNYAMIDRRIWRGQARVLFPLLEELRTWLLPRAKQLIRPPFMVLIGNRQMVIDDVDELELGQLEYHLWSTPLYPRVHCLAEMRRHLAHVRPLPAKDVMSSDFRRILSEYRNASI
jgi:hypothetical protein